VGEHGGVVDVATRRGILSQQKGAKGESGADGRRRAGRMRRSSRSCIGLELDLSSCAMVVSGSKERQGSRRKCGVATCRWRCSG
jgi:hypothetical protein